MGPWAILPGVAFASWFIDTEHLIVYRPVRATNKRTHQLHCIPGMLEAVSTLSALTCIRPRLRPRISTRNFLAKGQEY
jgi:hypothetical protein